MANEMTKQNFTTDPTLITSREIKQYFDPQGLLSDKQVAQAVALCRGRNLNPFTNEVYIVAYKSGSGTEFSLIVSKEAFLKRAESHPKYAGFEAGVVVTDSNGELVERKGSFTLPTDTLVGGWARVYRKDFEQPVEIYISRQEYDKKRSTWKSMPATMIRKTALVNALREAFPGDLGGMYTEDDGGETMDVLKDVTPQETQSEVRERKYKEIEEMKKEVADKKATQAKEEVLDY